MASLRRLNIEGCDRILNKLPEGIGRRNGVVVELDKFPVVATGGDAGGGGCSSSSNIGELGGMNIQVPKGRLDICNLEVVGSRDEARTAKLEEKTSLHHLVLSWGSSTDRAVDAEGVLEGLHPPPQLFNLKINNYPGQTFPSWMGNGRAIPHLREVVLERCENCTQLPPLGQLPSLERLTIAGLDGVERVGREFFGGPSPTFPCLKYLTFEEMRNWSEWVALSPICNEEEGSESPIMPKLTELEFYDCPKLKAMPPIFTTSLRLLTIHKSSPTLHHSSLQFLPLDMTITTVRRHFWHHLHIDAQYPLIAVVIDYSATELPAGLLRHTALRKLTLAHLRELRSLPEELTQLTALQQLLIQRCPELRGRCQIGGELWPLIAHIPHIQIDEQDIQCLT